MTLTSPLFSASVLAAAGVFQWTPWKRACLAHCQSPLQFLMTSWREGNKGALLMGLHHGTYCLGCCWLLMLVLFAVGVMNLWWVGLLSALVLLEKLAPYRTVSYATGAGLIAMAVWVGYPRGV
jgi:predicted metal-binding membrane protein